MTTYLCTGAAGFIAGHVIPLLYVDDALEVRGIDSFDNRAHPRIAGVQSPKPAWWQGHWKIGDYANTPPQLLNGVDTVIHLAAQVSVADSAVDPSRYIIENSEGTARFLLSLPPTVTRLVVASSMSVYGEGGELVEETDPVCPASVYGLTKYDQEQLCLMWGKQNNVQVIALRFFNVYGPGQSLDNPYTGVLANFAKRIMNDEQPIVFEDGQQTRDFIHVSDVARCVALAAKADVSGVYNVCTGVPATILQAAQAMIEGFGKDVVPHVTYKSRKGDIRHCTGNPLKAARDLKFAAQISFATGIQSYCEWLSH